LYYVLDLGTVFQEGNRTKYRKIKRVKERGREPIRGKKDWIHSSSTRNRETKFKWWEIISSGMGHTETTVMGRGGGAKENQTI